MCDNVSLARGFSQFGEDKMLQQNFFCDNCSGRKYVEIGALDGVKYSNTFLLERQYRWSGVLIEGHPENAAKLFRARGASGHNIIFNEAICPKPTTMTFSGPSEIGTAGILDFMDEKYLRRWGHRFRHAKNHSVPCRPLATLLHLAGIQQIDFFSLDVEGAEYEVLKTMDWSIPVRVWLVEMDGTAQDHRSQAVRQILAKNGYVEARISVRGPNRLFVHRDLNSTLLQRMQWCSGCKK